LPPTAAQPQGAFEQSGSKEEGNEKPDAQTNLFADVFECSANIVDRLPIAPDEEKNQADQAEVAENGCKCHQRNAQGPLLYCKKGKGHGRHNKKKEDRNLNKLLGPIRLGTVSAVSLAVIQSRYH
jgi:hypothetical protein